MADEKLIKAGAERTFPFPDPASALEGVRFLTASALPRGRSPGFDPGSVERLRGLPAKGEISRYLSFGWHLVPHYLADDVAQSALAIGWEPRLHADERWFVQVAPELKMFLPYERDVRFGGRLAVQLGFRTSGWLLTDIEIGPTGTLDPLDRARALGMELSSHLLVDKVRVAVGFPAAFAHRGGPGFSFDPRGLTISLGLSDLNGLLYWAFHELTLGKCQEHCEQEAPAAGGAR
jgi:hypothetical protein